MLAELFMLKLENQARMASLQMAADGDNRFVPITRATNSGTTPQAAKAAAMANGTSMTSPTIR